MGNMFATEYFQYTLSISSSLFIIVLISLHSIHELIYNYAGPIAIEYNNKIDDIYFGNSIEISFEMQLTAPCSAPTGNPFCRRNKWMIQFKSVIHI